MDTLLSSITLCFTHPSAHLLAEHPSYSAHMPEGSADVCEYEATVRTSLVEEFVRMRDQHAGMKQAEQQGLTYSAGGTAGEYCPDCGVTIVAFATHIRQIGPQLPESLVYASIVSA